MKMVQFCRGKNKSGLLFQRHGADEGVGCCCCCWHCVRVQFNAARWLVSCVAAAAHCLACRTLYSFIHPVIRCTAAGRPAGRYYHWACLRTFCFTDDDRSSSVCRQPLVDWQMASSNNDWPPWTNDSRDHSA